MNNKIESVFEFRDDILELYKLYLNKHKKLNDREKAAFCSYFEHLSNPPIIISGEPIDPKDFGAIHDEH